MPADPTPPPVPAAPEPRDQLRAVADDLIHTLLTLAMWGLRDEARDDLRAYTEAASDALAAAADPYELGVAACRTAAAARLVELIRDLADPDPCWFDHHGYCQAHGWTATDPRCPHARAKDVLAAGGKTDAR